MAALDEAGSFLNEPAVESRDRDLRADRTKAPAPSSGRTSCCSKSAKAAWASCSWPSRREPIQRTVALKIIKPGMDTRQVIARFEAERQALAMMDHPNIAKVLDAGTTDRRAERPARYFVMELVKGVPITKYCDEQTPAAPRTAGAVRCPSARPCSTPIKRASSIAISSPRTCWWPSTTTGPCPKVIDFGVAKATAQQLTERTMFTEFGQVVGTFEYMSPEQAKLNQLDIDTRSDIYSLGVLLYELLTGNNAVRPQAAAAGGVRRGAADHPRGGTAQAEHATQLQRDASIDRRESAHRAGALDERRSRRAGLDRDEGLEKDRNRRYETANDFALDLQRYLDDQPVQAGPPSLSYKLRKLVRRNKRTVAIFSVLGAVLVCAIAIAAGSIGWVVRDRQTRTAVVEREIQLALDEATASLNDRPREAAAALRKAEALMNTIDTRPAVQHRVQQWKADLEMLQRMREIHAKQLSDIAAAEKSFRDAIRRRPEVSLSHAFLSWNLALQGKYAEAEECARQAVRLNPREPWGHHCLGSILAKQQKFAESVPHYRAEMELRSDRPETHIDLGWALRGAGLTTEADQEFAEAQRLDEGFRMPVYAGNAYASEGRLTEATGHFFDQARANPGDLGTGLRTASLLLVVGHRDRYEQVCRQMLKQASGTKDGFSAFRVCAACLTSPQPVGDIKDLRRLAEVALENETTAKPNTPYPTLFCRAGALLAYRTADWDRALKWSRQSRKHTQLMRDSPTSTAYFYYDAENLVVEAMALHQLGRTDEAQQAYREASKCASAAFPFAPNHLGSNWIDWVMYETLRHKRQHC